MVTRAAYDNCYKAIMGAKLEKPHVYESFTEYFDHKKLADIRDNFGYDLYMTCLGDANEVLSKWGA